MLDKLLKLRSDLDIIIESLKQEKQVEDMPSLWEIDLDEMAKEPDVNKWQEGNSLSKQLKEMGF